MKINNILANFEKAPQGGALLHLLKDKSQRNIFLQGLVGSATSVFFASLSKRASRTFLFVLNDADEAGYLYHDLVQMIGQEQAFFFPSSYRRAVKYGRSEERRVGKECRSRWSPY